MHRRVKPNRRSASQRCRRVIFIAVVVLVTAALFLFTVGDPTAAGSYFGAETADVTQTMWPALYSAGRNAAFCAARLLPRLPAEETAASIGSVYELANIIEDARQHQRYNHSSYRELVQRVGTVYHIDRSVGQLHVPPAFADRALSMFPALAGSIRAERLRQLENQPIVTVSNRHTKDMTYFNNIRRFRPGAEAVLTPEDEAGITKLYTAGGTAAECDLCSVERTAEDLFGRKMGPSAYTAANVAKLGRWHSLVIARSHNPLDYSLDSIEDMVNLSVAWLDEVAAREPEYEFGNMICDIGKRASASQTHLHFQVWMTKGQFATGFAKMLVAARAHEAQHGTSYWAALVEAHAAAGLVQRVGSAFVFPHLSPAKEKEVIVLEPHRTRAFARAVAHAMVALRDEGQARSMSMGMALPYAPIGTAADMPAIFRIIDRGNPLDPRGDTGGLEYFTSPYVGTDPYRVAAWLRQSAAMHPPMLS